MEMRNAGNSVLMQLDLIRLGHPRDQPSGLLAYRSEARE
jgi:hypothetical protein